VNDGFAFAPPFKCTLDARTAEAVSANVATRANRILIVRRIFVPFSVPEVRSNCHIRLTSWAIGITPSRGSPPNTRGSIPAESGSDCLEAGSASQVPRTRMRGGVLSVGVIRGGVWSVGVLPTSQDHDRLSRSDVVRMASRSPARRPRDAGRSGHHWIDRHGRVVDGWADGGSCGGCGWRPDDPEPATA
jgi:hypothetical protein